MFKRIIGATVAIACAIGVHTSNAAVITYNLNATAIDGISWVYGNFTVDTTAQQVVGVNLRTMIKLPANTFDIDSANLFAGSTYSEVAGDSFIRQSQTSTPSAPAWEMGVYDGPSTVPSVTIGSTVISYPGLMDGPARTGEFVVSGSQLFSGGATILIGGAAYIRDIALYFGPYGGIYRVYDYGVGITYGSIAASQAQPGQELVPPPATPQVPLPGALMGMLAAIGLTGLIARRR